MAFHRVSRRFIGFYRGFYGFLVFLGEVCFVLPFLGSSKAFLVVF